MPKILCTPPAKRTLKPDAFTPQYKLITLYLYFQMTGQQILSMFLIMGCFMSVVMAGIGGFNSGLHEEIDPNVKKLAGAIIALCILVLAINVFGMCTLCTYGSFFGVNMQRRHRGVWVTQNANGTTVVTMAQNNTGGHQMGGMQTDPAAQSLQEQNRLLQQQIQLQQQLINQQQQQQQQQQTQYGFQPTAPPTYGMNNTAYPPTVSYPSTAPPSYDKVA